MPPTSHVPGGGPGPRTASPRTARLINDRTAFELLLEHGALSRSRLQSLTGLSRPTVGDLVDRLEHAGVIAPAGESKERRRGPNAVLYAIVADRAHAAGVEVRPGEVLAAVTDLTGRQVGSARVPLDPDAAPDEVVHGAVTAALADAQVPAAGLQALAIGTPGLVDPATGDVGFVGALPSWHANLLPGLRRRLGIPVVVENEVNLIGLAEHRLGAARGRDTFALLALGTGIGMAVVLGGRLHRGASGGAGELSYLPVGAEDAPRRTFPRIADGEAVAELARAHGLPAEDGAPWTAVAAAVEEGASGFLDALADRVAFGAAAVCSVLDPGFLVLAGPVGRAGGTELAHRVEERVGAATPLPTRVAPGTVTGRPVVRGALGVALDLLHETAVASA